MFYISPLVVDLGGDALTANPLSQFAATTSAQLAGVVSDETGTDKLVFSASPTFTGTLAAAAASFTGQITSTVATGTAPLVIASTTLVPNLNASLLNGTTFASPGVIGATTSNSAFFQTISVATKVAVGGVTAVIPPTALSAGDSGTSSPRGIMSWQSNDGIDGARLHLRKSRGTFPSPAIIVTGDMLGKLVASGYDGANFIEMASIGIEATGTIAATRVPTKMVFSTATDATPSVLTPAMTITSGGNVGIGTSVPTVFAGYTTLAINNASQGGLLELQSNGATAMRLLSDAAKSYIYEERNLPLGIYTTAAERVSILANGNVGIGTTSPDARLEIESTTGPQFRQSYDPSNRLDVYVGSTGGVLLDAVGSGAGFTFSAPIKPSGYTVATLPAGVVGQHAYVTDALAPTYLVAVVGGGAVTCPVFYNGAGWISH